ncbi:MAG: alpha-D-glucose phosphate-specific phosphoglucomutase [Anaerolineae bacterium]|nr:alpha-D-glucose phosphate-specific phosphoglucomutase [Anaerolineae bacterium]
MSAAEMAGKPATRDMLVHVPRLISDYYTIHPEASQIEQSVSFGTSGHRGTSANGSFNEDHIAAICQAICKYRVQQNITGPLFIGKDTHALSEAAERTAIEVFAANGVEIRISEEYTPTPVISHAILTYNQGRDSGFADGVVITPSHNPPEDGGFKYNLVNGGPADSETTGIIQDWANEMLKNGLKDVARIPLKEAQQAQSTREYDYVLPYVRDLENVIDFDAIRAAKVKIGVEPMGGAAANYWEVIADVHKLDLTVVNNHVDPTFSFMSLDHDGKIRMDCSSPYAMTGLIGLKDDFDIAFGNDPDVDRHGIVTRSSGLLNPNHYLAVAIWYLFRNRPNWRKDLKIGKTLVSSSMIDRVVNDLGLDLAEVPVGFKWFVDGLYDGSYGFGGEESAGASFLRKDGTVWSTDKDGIILGLLAAEILAKTQRDPGEIYQELTENFGNPLYSRNDMPGSLAQRTILKNLTPEAITASTLAGDEITSILTRAPGNDALIGGLKVSSQNGWFVIRPSGTEDKYKIYAESFIDEGHLEKIFADAREIVQTVFKKNGVGE